MLVGCVVHHQVDKYAYAALLCAMREIHEVAQRAVAGVDTVVVGDVVAIVAMGRGLEGHQPDGRHAQSVQIVQPPRQTTKVADAIGVGIHVGANGQAIDDRVLVPEIADHAACLDALGSPKTTPSLGRRANGMETGGDSLQVEIMTRSSAREGIITCFGVLSKLSATSNR